MKEAIFRIKSISQLTEMMGFDKPTHPLIYLVNVADWVIPKEQVGVKYTTEFYTIALKDSSCGMQYGRHHYDFNEGVMIFTEPGQVAAATKEQYRNEIQGWMLFIHPDLFRNTHLGTTIQDYGFFSYEVHEALHLSEKEQQTVNALIEKIKEEIAERIDNHSNSVIVSSIELLLNYCSRYYERQFNTRSFKHKDIVSEVNGTLKQYYETGQFQVAGIPSVQYLADKVHLSQSYLSDVLKKETGRTAREHINDFLVDKAKTLLLSTSDSVSEIAFTLGFNYPHYFSRLFRSKTGVSPKDYRQLN